MSVIMSEPASPTSSVRSVRSFASAASAASTASTASTASAASTQKEINATSSIVKKFARLFNELSQSDKNAYLNMLAYYIDEIDKKVNKRFASHGSKSNEDYMRECYQTIIDGTVKVQGGNCGGALITRNDIPAFYKGFANFLHNFRFPDAPKGTTAQPELSLPMLDFVSELTSILEFRAAATNVNDVRKYTFEMGMVDKDSFTNIKYREDASVDASDIPEETADPYSMLVKPNEQRDKLIAFLTEIHVLNQSQSLGHAKGDNPLVRFSLGFIQKPTVSYNVRPLAELDQKHVNLCFRLDDNADNDNKILIILVIDMDPSPVDGSRACKFMIDEVKTGGVFDKWTWSGKINDLKFFPTLAIASSSGGRNRRRLSKTKKVKNVRARSTRRRHNIKKRKRSAYIKSRNTKRNLRRFRH